MPATLLARIRTHVNHPATSDELARLLRVPRDHRAAFRRQLRQLVAQGDLVETRFGHYGLAEHMDVVTGRLSMSSAGYGFVEPERVTPGRTSDIYVAGPDLNEAMHGDRVLARVEREGAGGRPAGRILRVIERAQRTVVGRFDVDASGLRFVVPFDRRLTMDIVVPAGDQHGAAPGEMVVVEITRWPTAARGPVGRVVEVLGSLDTPGVDVRIILRKHDIPDAHGDAALAEARRLGREVRPRDLAGRIDFRDRIVVTIDGEHARDFDDAVSIERLPNGHCRLGVHIADVAHYVAEESALDREARERGTSVYFPDRAVHMFPEDLATGLCSLRPHVDRLVQSCLMEVDARGEVVHYELHDGVINSSARLTYTEVNAILAGRDEATRASHAALVPALDLMHELYEALHARRHRRGAVDFDLPEPEIVLDAAGLVSDIVASERNVAHRLVEEFMLLANETVAAHLEARGWPAVYRVHERPDPLKVAELESFMGTLGYSLGAEPDAVRPRHFQRLVERIAGAPEERPIAFLILRTMQKARYDVVNLGHFGLAAGCYTHFTSPIRRYPDLLVHRALRAERQRPRALDEDAREQRTGVLRDWARIASERERRADEAERELLQWKKVRFMSGKVGETFDGYVTGVAAFGLFVTLADHFVEGMVHVSTMTDDYYRFAERAHVLIGENTGRRYRLGDRVSVRVARVDFERRQVELALEDVLQRLGRRRSGGREETVPHAPKAARRPDTRGHKASSKAAGGRAKKSSSSRPGKRERAAMKPKGRKG